MTKKCGTGFQKEARKAIRRMYIWLPRTKWTHLRLDTALLVRHKDANLRATKKCGAGFHKACHGICSADAPQGCKPALDQAFKARQSSADAPQGCKLALGQEVRHWLQLYICLLKPVYIFKARQGSVDAPQGCKPALDEEVRHWLPKAISRMSLYICVFREKQRHIKGSTGPCWCATRMQSCASPRSAALASKKQLSFLSKAISRMSRFVCLTTKK